MIARTAILAALAGAAWSASGCGDPGAVAPPEIHFGQDVCEVCGMIISDERFAAGLVVEADGRYRPRRFDDLICLLDYEQNSPAEPVAARYVRDARTRAWLEAGTASYVHSRTLHTPMASGLAACATEADARAMLAEHPGDLIGFPEARQRFREGRLRVIPPEEDES